MRLEWGLTLSHVLVLSQNHGQLSLFSFDLRIGPLGGNWPSLTRREGLYCSLLAYNLQIEYVLEDSYSLVTFSTPG